MNETKPIQAGDILHTSWGYDMTMNDFAVVLKNTGKTLLCQMVGCHTVEGNAYAPGGATVKANPADKYGKPFRVRINKGQWGVSLVGSYPYCETQARREPEDSSKRRGYWSIIEDTDKGFYENHLD